ncbi:PrsW family glutamic-type intramembrane protease [Deltaproteobacteria bacterium TL4]
MALTIFGLVIGPALLWCWFFYHSNRYKRSNLKLLFWLYLSGMGCGFIALLLNHLIKKYTLFWPEATETLFWNMETGYPLYSAGFWLLVGFNEEFAKLLALLFITFPSKYLQEPFDGILYAAVVALGFASIENLLYLDQYGSFVIVFRSVITLPAHTFMSVPMGYCVARARILLNHSQTQPALRGLLIHPILGGWVLASLLHGCYDLLLSQGHTSLAYLQIMVMGIFSVGLSFHALRRSPYLPQISMLPEPSNWRRFFSRMIH